MLGSIFNKNYRPGKVLYSSEYTTYPKKHKNSDN